MKKLVMLMLGALLVVELVAQGSTAQGTEQKVLEFDTMRGVSAPFLNPNNPIRGVNGGGVPWAIQQGIRGELQADGDLEVTVRGLVVAATGVNPSATFRAVVSCQSIDGLGNATVVNVSTAPVPATTTGDADIEETLTLPSPCLAPIVFVGRGADPFRWFAITGN